MRECENINFLVRTYLIFLPYFYHFCTPFPMFRQPTHPQPPGRRSYPDQNSEKWLKAFVGAPKWGGYRASSTIDTSSRRNRKRKVHHFLTEEKIYSVSYLLFFCIESSLPYYSRILRLLRILFFWFWFFIIIVERRTWYVEKRFPFVEFFFFLFIEKPFA